MIIILIRVYFAEKAKCLRGMTASPEPVCLAYKKNLTTATKTIV